MLEYSSIQWCSACSTNIKAECNPESCDLHCIVHITGYCIVQDISLYCIVQWFSVYCIVVYCIALYCIVVYYIALHCDGVLYCIVLYWLYCIALHCIVLCTGWSVGGMWYCLYCIPAPRDIVIVRKSQRNIWAPLVLQIPEYKLRFAEYDYTNCWLLYSSK